MVLFCIYLWFFIVGVVLVREVVAAYVEAVRIACLDTCLVSGHHHTHQHVQFVDGKTVIQTNISEEIVLILPRIAPTQQFSHISPIAIRIKLESPLSHF